MTAQQSHEAVPSFSAARLRTARASARLTTTALGDQARVSRSDITRFERGTVRPGFHVVLALADALNLEPLDLTDATPGHYTVADHRLANRTTRVDLADRIGLSYNTWYSVETGRRRLTDGVAANAAAMLGISVDELRAALARRPDR